MTTARVRRTILLQELGLRGLREEQGPLPLCMAVHRALELSIHAVTTQNCPIGIK
jgi:hypothetical protein